VLTDFGLAKEALRDDEVSARSFCGTAGAWLGVAVWSFSMECGEFQGLSDGVNFIVGRCVYDLCRIIW
jgi:hypothetical protein